MQLRSADAGEAIEWKITPNGIYRNKQKHVLGEVVPGQLRHKRGWASF